MSKLLTRRRVLLGAGVAFGGAVAGALIKYPPLRVRGAVPTDNRVHDLRPRAEDPSMPQLAIAQRGADPSALTEDALGALGGLGRFINKGDVVVVKPNVTWKRNPIHAANTNPQVVAVVVREALRAGAKRVVVTDHSGMDPDVKFQMSGVGQAASDAGAEILLVRGADAFEEVSIRGQVLDAWPVLRCIMKADKVINVPVAKQHNMRANFSAALKNSFGMVGGDRVRLHWELQRTIVDLSAFLRSTLHVVDATRVLVRNGPQGGNLADVVQKNTVIASVDPVATDTYASELLGIDPASVDYLALAEARGLGTMDWKKLRVRRI